MSRVCYTQTRTSTSYSTTTIRLTTYRNSVTTLRPTGTRTVGQVSTIRVPYVTSLSSYITHKTTYGTTSCGLAYGKGSQSEVEVPTGIIVSAVIVGLWAIAMLGAVIFVLCFSRTAKRGRMRKGQGGFGQNNQPQQYTAVPQEPLYSQSESQYAPSSNSPYGGMQQSLEANPQTSYVGYQNYNALNVGAQGTSQWPTPTPSTPAGSSTSGPGPGYIPPGAAAPVFGNPAAGGTISYSINSTTPSPPPGSKSDPHRMLYTQQNDRLSAAVSLVHPQQPQPHSQEQRPPSSYSTTGPSFGPQPHLSSSQAHLAAQYRGYAEPSTHNDKI